MNTEQVAISDITVPAHRARGLNTEAVNRLAESVKRIGLQTPITLRYDRDKDDILLVAGLHRLEAARSLGWETILAIYSDGTPEEARMWEISENLHRADLSAVELAEHIEEWRTLAVKVRHGGAPSGGRQPTEQGIRQTARDLGVGEATVRRAAAIASLAPEVKEQAKAEDWSQARALAAATGKPAPAIKNAFESEEDWRRSLFTVWNRGAQDWRERAMEAMDRPVFDRSGQ